MSNPSDSLIDLLLNHNHTGPLPMHMPGHKRNATLAPYLNLLRADLDLTEIEGFDNLHAPDGILAASMARAASLWGSHRAFYLVNGSTCGILAGIRACTQPGDQVLVARNCHKSVYHALELCGLDPVFYLPPSVPNVGFSGAVEPKTVEKILDTTPEIRLIVLTSPTYEGVISDISHICAIAHRRQIPVLVDEAHGAHLGFHSYFPSGAVAGGADLVIQSLHKTLPSLTQTAIAHVQGTLVSPEKLARELSIFETSSPSYLLLSSIDGCVRLLQDHASHIFHDWADALESFHEACGALQHLQVFGHSPGTSPNSDFCFAIDPSKLVICTGHTELTGPALMRLLREDFSIELEMAAPGYAIAMTGPGDTRDTLSTLAQALLAIDGTLSPVVRSIDFPLLSLPERRLSMAQALEASQEFLPPQQAAGRIAGETIWAYPPGIPLILPGEVFSPHLLGIFQQMDACGIRLQSTSRQYPHDLSVVKNRGTHDLTG
jgi:arginine decarboxylase